MNILCVDDEVEIRDMLVEMLYESEGHVVTAVGTIQEALETVSETCDLIICDLRLATLSGTDYIEIIRVRYPTMPVIVLSAYIENEEELLALGATKVLSKPVHLPALLEAIHSVS